MDYNSYKKSAWTTFIACFLANCVAGCHYCWSVLSKSMITEYGFTATQATLPYTVFGILSGFFCILGGAIAEKLSPRITVLTGGICLGAGLFLTGLTTNPTVMLLTIGVLVGYAGGVLPNTDSMTAGKWFPHKKGMITGGCAIGVGLASVYFAPIMNHLSATQGISKTFFIVGGVALVTVCIFSMFIKTPPAVKDMPKEVHEELAKLQAKNSSVNPVGADVMPKDIFKKKAFYMLFALYVFTTIGGLMLSSQMAIIASVQAGWEAGFILVVIMQGCNAAGRFIWGSISDKLGVYKTWMISFTLQGVNMLLFALYKNPVSLGIGAAIAGFTFGGSMPLFQLASAVEFGNKYMITNYGLFNWAYGIGSTIGPMLAAYCLDTSGTYTVGYIFAGAVILVLSLPTTYMLYKSHKNEAPVAA